ncbi:MAG: phosphohistidine phosphatase [Proteobacteria bacterium]|nr:MAG: phosphohistidine phosphatase [Pseudomonadota bacterium]
MRRLLLLRHAKTERDSATGRDRDRALDARGRDDAAEIGAFMMRQPHPARVLVSTAARARETWDLLPAALRSIPVEHRDDLYGAETGDLLDIVRTVDGDPDTLLVVAHNPGLHELALALTNGGDEAAWQELNRNLPTGGLITIELPAADWHGISLRSGRLTGLMTPKLLRAQSGA